MNIEKRLNNMESLLFWTIILSVSLFTLISKKHIDNIYITFFLIIIILVSYPIVSFRFTLLAGQIGASYGLKIGDFIIKHFDVIKKYGFWLLQIIGLILVKHLMNITWKYLLGFLVLEVLMKSIFDKLKKIK